MPCLLESEQIYIFNRVGFLPVLVLRIAPRARGEFRFGCPRSPASELTIKDGHADG